MATLLREALLSHMVGGECLAKDFFSPASTQMMKRLNRRILLSGMVVCCALLTSPFAHALTQLTTLNKGQANELGISVIIRPYGDKVVWVELAFDIDGALKDYSPEKRRSRVELRWEEEDHRTLMQVPLQETKLSQKRRQVKFMVPREHVSKLKLWIVVGAGLIPGGAFELTLSDYFDPARYDPSAGGVESDRMKPREKK